LAIELNRMDAGKNPINTSSDNRKPEINIGFGELSELSQHIEIQIPLRNLIEKLFSRFSLKKLQYEDNRIKGKRLKFKICCSIILHYEAR
jgi:hypothetical protein